MKNIFFIAIIMFSFWATSAQNTLIETETSSIYRDAIELLDKRKYAAAQRKFAEYRKEGTDTDKKIFSQYYQSVCALHLKQTSAERMITDFITEYPVHPASKSAYFDLGDYYFEKQDFKKAEKYLKLAAVPRPSTTRDIEATYKLAYSYYFQKKYKNAEPLFNKIKVGLHKYVSLASYYAGQIAYQNGKYDVALADFKRAAESEQFREEVENILPVIYYQQQQYDEVKRIVDDYKSNGKKMSPNLNLLAGEIAFQENDFTDAAERLEAYVKAEKDAERGIYYRLGMAKLRTNQRDDAIKYLGKAADGNDALAQVAAYHMGLTYVSIKKADFADVAFDKVRKLSFDKKIQEEGAYYFAKVNYGTKDFTKVIEGGDFYEDNFPQGKYLNEIRGWSSEALANAGDYNKALAKMDSMRTKTTSVKQAYQQVAYNKAVLDYNDGKFRSAVDNLVKSVRYPLDKELESKAYFWMAEAYAYGYKYQEAAIYYQRVSSQYDIYTQALYGLGYAQYNQEEYDKALTTFTKYLDRPIESGERKLDAVVRLADCYYVTKNYDKAITLYGGAIRANAENLDYIYYQKALAELAGGRRNQASQTLDFIMTNFPDSKNLDRVYFEKAQLYFEINDMATAVEWYGKFLNFFPDHPQVARVYLRRGLANKIAGNVDASIADYKYIIDVHPKSDVAEDAIKSLNEIHLSGYSISDIIAYQRKFTEANPKSSINAEIEFGAASKPFNLGEYELAIQTLSEFLSKYPNSKKSDEANLQLAQSYDFSGKKKEAIPYYKKVDGDSKAKAVKGAADAELALGMYEDAVSDYLQLSKLAPTYNPRYEEFAAVGLMKSYLGIDDYEAVNIYANQLINQKSTRYTNLAQLYKGKALMKQKQYAQAIQQFNYTINVAGVSRESAEAQHMIGSIYREQKQYERSIEALKEVQKKYENFYEIIHEAFLTLADNYIDLDNTLQAKATLKSVIEASKDPAVINRAKTKLASIK